MKSKHLSLILWIAVWVWLLMLLNELGDSSQLEPKKPSFSQFLEELQDGSEQSVTFRDRTIDGTRTDGSYFATYYPSDPGLVDDLLNHGVVIRAGVVNLPTRSQSIPVAQTISRSTGARHLLPTQEGS
jgi:ATP-dependent Zn protease